MHKAHPFILLFFLFSQVLNAQQELSGRVLDSETGAGVPFVNIGVPKLGKGTVSNSEGYYELSLKSGAFQVRFSSIGYETREVPSTSLEGKKEVRLAPKTELLDEVVINADRFGEEVILGEKLDSKGHSIGFSGRMLGTEIGAHIKVRKESLLKSAHFTVNFTGADSLLFRVNIYDFSKGSVGEKLIKENIIITAPQRKGTFDIDLMPYNIKVESDVLLSLEWVQDDNGQGNEGLMFRSKKGRGTNLYSKRTSFAEFKKISDEISFAPKLKIGFYLKAIQKP